MTDARNMRKLMESVNGMSDKDFLREYSEDENVVEELEYIQEQMQDLLGQAANIVSGTSEASSAQAYWLAHIETALTKDHGDLGGRMTKMQDTIDALRQGNEEDEEDSRFDDPNPRGR